MQFPEKLVRLRKRRGLTQAQAAELVDTSRQAISKWESGTGVPTLENIKALARVYGVSFDTLLDDSRDLEDEAAPSPQPPAEGPAARQPRPSNKRRLAMAGAAAVLLILLAGTVFWIHTAGQGKDSTPLEELECYPVDPDIIDADPIVFRPVNEVE